MKDILQIWKKMQLEAQKKRTQSLKKKKFWFHVNSPELAVIFDCDAKVSSLSVADLFPLFRAEEQKAKQFKMVLMTSHGPTKLFYNPT